MIKPSRGEVGGQVSGGRDMLRRWYWCMRLAKLARANRRKCCSCKGRAAT